MFMLTRDRETGEPMSDKELIDEVLTLIVAGHETTAAALTWTWYLVSQHPEAAERLQAEADRTAAGQTLGLDAAEAMSFTHQVLQESLRLYPPGWLITRRTIEADELGGFPIAPRTDVFISPYMLHRHPAFWSDAEEFQAGALRRRRCRRAPSIRLYSLCGRTASLHRREYRHVRNAGAHAHHDAPLSPEPRERRTH